MSPVRTTEVFVMRASVFKKPALATVKAKNVAIMVVVSHVATVEREKSVRMPLYVPCRLPVSLETPARRTQTVSVTIVFRLQRVLFARILVSKKVQKVGFVSR